MKLGVAFGWHSLTWEELRDCVRHAESLGFDTAYVDGDVSMLGSRGEADVLDGWSVQLALLAATTRIRIASIRLVHHWNAARLAQATATAERIFPGRSHLFASIGERPEDVRFGLPLLSPVERVEWLDESLDAVRALWRGGDVTRKGRFVSLDRARLRPTPPGGALPVEIGARRHRLLRVVARHADVWNINLPPVASRVARASAELASACEDVDRDPAQIRRRMLVFARVQARPDPDAALLEFRRLNPWFADIPDAEVAPSLAVGDAAACRTRLAESTLPLGLELPILDLTGADAATTRVTLDAFPEGIFVD
ncbi:MAG TPA: LLM class flavin-dependent oxidoreductase [Myxococcota bacterium]|nr:LLM class flavin-dependent oxidoreductase [Myxococcota bacterium]